MAAAPLHSCWGVPELRFFHSLLAFWCAFVGSGSAVTVTQAPTFAKGFPGKDVSFSCSVDAANYYFYWYRQVPGKTELEVLGYFSSSTDEFEGSPAEWKGRLKAKWNDGANKRSMSLDLTVKPDDTGFYLCAPVDTVKERGTVASAKLSIRNESALYYFLLISIFYLTSYQSMGNSALHPSALIFKIAFCQFMPFRCTELQCLHWPWGESFVLTQYKTIRTVLHDKGKAILAQHLTSHSGQPDVSGMLANRRQRCRSLLQLFYCNWNVKAWCP
ncbi:uncharacterized protein LOC134505077 [Candoia aspera]|uniref:uncharacterized protein LOC134505077 n=1 Tax=Candoia aspera TaxID=51853 RepID=UPI002FD7B718